MPLTALESSTISYGIQAAQKALELEALLHKVNINFDGLGNVKNTVTQLNLDATPSLSGLTDSQLNDSMYVLTALILPVLQSNYAALSNLAARG
jgi:hypothetical protein